MKALTKNKLNGRLVPGSKKYEKMKYRGIDWKDISEFVKKRDGQCLKCGNKKYLQADHFHPSCYIWIRAFFNPNKIQTLCRLCHSLLPTMKIRKKNYKEFIYLK